MDRPGRLRVTNTKCHYPGNQQCAAQIYTVVGTAPNSCTLSNTATLSTWVLPLPTYTAPTRVCFNTSMQLRAESVAKTYTGRDRLFIIPPVKTLTIPFLIWIEEGTYTLTVTDSLGCVGFYHGAHYDRCGA